MMRRLWLHRGAVLPKIDGIDVSNAKHFFSGCSNLASGLIKLTRTDPKMREDVLNFEKASSIGQFFCGKCSDNVYISIE
jgi:hypothetical protein